MGLSQVRAELHGCSSRRKGAAVNRVELRYVIEDAIDSWRDEDHGTEFGVVRLFDPDEVKMLSRHIRDAIQARYPDKFPESE
jgi:hypothetical protein